MEQVHHLLERQLQQHFGKNFVVPKEWRGFVEVINDTYSERLKLEEQLSKLAATTPGVIHAYRLHPDGTTCFPYANAGIENIYGCKPEELVEDATPALKHTHPDDLPRLKASVQKSAQTLSLWREEFRVNHPRKGLIWVEGCSAPVREPDGSILWHGFLLDITERKRTEEELRWKTTFLEAKVDSAPDGVLVVDNQGKIILQNRRLNELWKFPKQIAEDKDDAGRLQFAINHAKNPRQFAEKVAYLYSHPDEVSRDELELVDGTILDRYSSPVKDKNGTLYGRIWYFRDITDRKRVEQELRRIVSLLQSTFDSTADGILVVDSAGRIVSFNERFSSLWQMPETILDSRDDDAALAHVLSQLKNPEEFLQRVRELYASPGQESFDVLEFKDGRVFERYSCPQRLDDVPVGRVWSFRDVTDRVRGEAALRESERRLRTLAEASFEGICISENGRVLDVNDQFAAMFGYGRDELIGREIALLIAPEWRQAIVGRINSGDGKPIEHQCLHKDGSVFECEAQARTISWDGREVRVSAVRDLTQRKQLEAQLRQSQKMQAFGQLAAGVAHDFNNVLTVIQGNVSLLLTGQLSPAEQASASTETFRAVERAANLTRQLLTFSRRQPMQAKDLDLNEVVTNITKMLRRLIGEDIALETRYAPGGAAVHADPGMMEQVLMNLVVNSRDAMPKGGRLTIETALITLTDTTRFTKHTARPGEFVRLSITDTGCGIAREHMPHLFEPFFTTKEVGKGTGLGLATVFGIVEQHQGWIEVESQANQGTTFQVYFPRLLGKVTDQTASSPPPQIPGGTETILLVEDEAALRRLMQRVLERQGYHIHAAVSGVQALEVWRGHREEIDMLVTDMVMPDGMNGRELADRLRAEKPDLKILYCSGYTSNLPGKDSPLRRNERFLEKPFEPVKLLQKVRDCADVKN